MSKKKNIPEIRFTGFDDEWEETELKQLVDLRSGRDYKHLSTGNIPVYGTGGYMLSVNEALSYEQDAIGIGRKGTIDKPYILRAPFWTVDTLFFAVPSEDNNIDFIYDIFQNINWKQKNEATGVPSLSKLVINKTIVKSTRYTEQSRIGSYFQHLDKLINLHQKKYDKLAALKKAMLGKMFPIDGADVPEIRFKGFTGKWEEKKLGEITTPYSNPVPTPHNGYWRLGIRSHAKGTFHSYVKAGRELDTAQMHIVNANNLIVNITFPWEHAIAITDNKDKGKLVSHRFPQFSFNDGMISTFFKFLIPDIRFKHHLSLCSPGGAGRNRVLKTNEMLEYMFLIPMNSKEQQKIGTYFQNLDKLISLHQKELDKLKNIKKACLEKMFV